MYMNFFLIKMKKKIIKNTLKTKTNKKQKEFQSK